MIVIGLDDFVGQKEELWSAYCPKINHLQVVELDPSEISVAELPGGIQTLPSLLSASISHGLQDNVADRRQGQNVPTVQMDGEVDKESNNERAATDVSVLTEKDLQSATAAGPEANQHGLFIQPLDQFDTAITHTLLSENSPAEETETTEPILIAQNLTPIDGLVENSVVIATTEGPSASTSLAPVPTTTSTPSVTAKKLPRSEVIKKWKDVKKEVKAFKKILRFMRKFNAKTRAAKRASRKRKAKEAGAQSKPEDGPSEPKIMKRSTRSGASAVPKPSNSTVKAPSVRTFQKAPQSNNLAPACSVATFFGNSTNRRPSISPPIPATESGPEVAGSNPDTLEDTELDFDSIGSNMEVGNDFFDGLLDDLPEVGVDISDITDLSGMIDGDIPELINLVLD